VKRRWRKDILMILTLGLLSYTLGFDGA